MPAINLEVCIDVRGPMAVLRVHGEVDVASAADFGALVHTVISRGHQNLVLDLGELDFMDAAMLGAIAGAAHRLQQQGGTLTIASAGPMVRRMLEITEMSSLLGSGAETGTELGSEQPAGEPAPVPQRDGFTDQARRVTAIPADDDVVDGALRLVVALARATVGGADGVSVSLRRRGLLSTVAASDATILAMDADQYATGEGPCIDASIEGRWFHAESLAHDARWPAFSPRARALGIHAILSSPLLAGNRPVGALNIYSRTESAFGPQDQRLAAVFAAETSTILTNAGLDVTDAALAERLQSALLSRQVITQAQGILMEREGLSAEDGYGMLLAHSRATSQPLRERAVDVIASSRRTDSPAVERGGGTHQ